jgi:spore maturation protein CgeB
MKILLVMNKYLQRGIFKRIDAGYWNFYIPLLQLGHQVKFYDISEKEQLSFLKVVEEFKPELIFCCLTFDKYFMPNEPLEEIENITKQGNIKTFNWFCDDTWRFDTTSKQQCWKFSACSTPEPRYLEKFKDIGYKNIILGLWHTNSDLSLINSGKNYDVAFCGSLNNQRANMIQSLRSHSINVNMFFGVSQEEMMNNYSLSKVGINFSINENDPNKSTQMKLRMIEIPSVKTTLLTQYTEGLEDLFEINKEIITFKQHDEMLEKLKYLLSNEKFCNSVAEAGYKRFLKNHDSKVRLENILQEINKI